MKFTKTAVAVAIAGIAAAPMIVSADTTLSGIVQIKLAGDDFDYVDDPATTDVDESIAGDPGIASGDVRIGVVAEHELNSGLIGYGGLRFDIDQLSNAGGTGNNDETYVGIKGGFGDFRMGDIPLAVEYGQVANDIFDVGADINGGVSYTGTFGPVGLIANFSPERNHDAVGIGAKFGIGGFSIGLGAEDRAELQNMSAGVSFAYAGASIAAHFWSKETAGAGDDDESISVKVGYGFGGVSAAVTFSTLEGASGDKEAIRLDLGYGLGGGMTVDTRITAASDNDNSALDKTDWRLQLTKTF